MLALGISGAWPLTTVSATLRLSFGMAALAGENFEDFFGGVIAAAAGIAG